MKTLKKVFGEFEGNKVDLFTLKNDKGMEVKITNYGATITSINLPNKNGVIEDITCGFDTLEGYFSDEYKANAPYFGSTIGRYTSQIKDSKIILNGIQYDLAKNCGENNLHGGTIGFDKKIWDAKSFENKDVIGLEMSLLSKDMEEGFPGNVSVTVTFSLNNNNELHIDYKATTDKDTPLSMTNHTYFNLSGFDSSIEDHTVQIFADKRQEWDSSGAATGNELSVKNQPDDLRNAKSIKSVHEAMKNGFEHYYIFDEKGFDLGKVAEIKCEKSGRTMEISTTEPGMLFYTGKYTSDSLQRESGAKFGKYKGFCCETHRYPNGPNITNSPKTILKVGEEFESTTIFKFK
ncbi:MAG: aldose epimerase family protein [Maribacter sp.]